MFISCILFNKKIKINNSNKLCSCIVTTVHYDKYTVVVVI